MARSAEQLRVIQLRPSMLFAHQSHGAIMPLVLALGLGFWMLAVWGMTGAFHGGIAIMCGLAALLCILLAPLLVLNGVWLSIDRHRGWVHWRQRRWPRTWVESFSPQRIAMLHLEGCGPHWKRLGVWRVVLRFDHPRLELVCLARAIWLPRITHVIRGLATRLEIDWVDEQGLLHVALPERETPENAWETGEGYIGAPPTPEITVEGSEERPRIVLPNRTNLADGKGVFLFYALVWCLWAWSSLLIEWLTFGPPEQWGSVQRMVISLLSGGSLAGAMMLVHAFFLLVGHQTLEVTQTGWRVSRRWLGMRWGRSLLRPHALYNLRRIDPPSAESGIWIPLGRGRLLVGESLDADSLEWLRQTLLRAIPV